MDRKVYSCDSLDELHELWKETQQRLPAPYLPDNIPRQSYLPDGIIDEDRYNKSRRILFVGKEAYWYDIKVPLSENEANADADHLYFWHQHVAFGKVKETIFSKRLSLLVNAINNNDFLTINKDHDCLKSIAFVNLNKRGGYSYALWDVLNGYVSQYAEYIAKEITLIAPSIIICCGHDVKWLLDNHVVQYLSGDIRIIAVHHPSYFALSDENYLLELQCALCGNKFSPRVEPKPRANVAEKGIMFDTNKTYSAGALYNMLTGKKISAYENAAKYVNAFNIGDYVFYYVKGKGIVAAGRVISDTATAGEFEGDAEMYKMVDIVVPSQVPFEEKDLQSLSPANLKALLGHGFYYASTTKRPYLTSAECALVVSALKDLYNE